MDVLCFHLPKSLAVNSSGILEYFSVQIHGFFFQGVMVVFFPFNTHLHTAQEISLSISIKSLFIILSL